METVQSPAEQRMILHDVSWRTYESLLEDHRDTGTPRFAYDRGTLEIMSPSPEHERVNRNIALIIEMVAAEFGIDVQDLGSTTFRREDLERGFEPDSCFYIQNEARIRGKDRIELPEDPPPDLVVEIDLTNPSLDKLPIYARLGVPEVWRYDGKNVSILRLEGDGYAEAGESAALPPLDAGTLGEFVEQSKKLRRTEWLRKLRGWARERSG
jgi:Uma2 family endonuclease